MAKKKEYGIFKPFLLKKYTYHKITKSLSLDFNSTIPPKYCGFDKSGDDKLCCSDLNGIPTVAVPQNPKYPISNPKLFDCVDHTPECSRWAKTHPDSCSPGHDSYEFMRSACQKTCRRCGSDVSYKSIQNCS